MRWRALRGFPDLKFHAEMVDHFRREWQDTEAEFLALGLGDVVLAFGVVGGELAAGENFEGLGAEAEFLVHALVVSAREEGDADFEEDSARFGGGVALAEGFATDAVGATGALFKDGGIPGQ